MSDFDYSKYYSPILPLADALREGDERCWSDGTERNKEGHDYVLYLGCNVLRTVNLAETMVAILKAMDLDFVALAGPANCCGIIHHGNGDFTISEKLTRQTLDKFLSYKPKALLTYCPSCHFHMDATIPDKGIAFDLPYLHITEFIIDNLDRLEFKHPVRRKLAAHLHHEGEQQQKDARFTMEILSRIEGLEVIELPATGDWGRHCSGVQIRAIGAERHNELADELFLDAKAKGLDGLITGYHSCYRELLHKQGEHGLEMIHFTNIVAEALGIEEYSDNYRTHKLAGDGAASFKELATAAEQRGVNMTRLEAATHAHFDAK